MIPTKEGAPSAERRSRSSLELHDPGEHMEEQRKLERFCLRTAATIEVVGDNGDARRLNLVTANICSDGAFFHTLEPLTEGSRVNIDLLLDLRRLKGWGGSGAHVKVSGAVLRAEVGGMAIRFDKGFQILPLYRE